MTPREYDDAYATIKAGNLFTHDSGRTARTVVDLDFIAGATGGVRLHEDDEHNGELPDHGPGDDPSAFFQALTRGQLLALASEAKIDVTHGQSDSDIQAAIAKKMDLRPDTDNAPGESAPDLLQSTEQAEANGANGEQDVIAKENPDGKPDAAKTDTPAAELPAEGKQDVIAETGAATTQAEEVAAVTDGDNKLGEKNTKQKAG